MKIVINIDPKHWFYIPYNIMKKYCKIKRIKFKPYIFTQLGHFDKVQESEAKNLKDKIVYYDRDVSHKNYEKAKMIHVERNDPDLIKILENEKCDHLKIVEIPDDVNWRVTQKSTFNEVEQVMEIVIPRTWT